MNMFSDDLSTPQKCLKAVEDDIWAFHAIPHRFKSSELCRIAVKKNGVLLEFVPLELKTEKLCRIAVENNGWSLHFVPELYKTEEICITAVKSHGWALHDVPEHLKTFEICEIALDNDQGAKKFVPKDIMKEYLQTDINDLQSLKRYIRFTRKKAQKAVYIEAFFKKATIAEIESVAPYISLKVIPKKSIPSLKNSKSIYLSNFARKKIPKRLRT